MACLRCERYPLLHPNSVPPLDPEVPRQRTMGTHGALIPPPAGFEPARICGSCGSVYYPFVPTVPRSG